MKPPGRLNSLPAQPSPLIGRTLEVLVLRQLMLREDVRLVTVTGAAGIGKTRLAITAAASLADDFPDGVVFVDLSAVSDPARVLDAIEKGLDLPEVGTLPSSARVQEALRDQALLLVLDNFEQVAPAAADLAGLLAGCEHLKLLVTSRAPLRIRWEHVEEVPPLELPDLARLPPLDQLGGVPAVALFVDRARAVRPDFRLDDGNARAVAELCTRLDGLPLAIELAAARARLLSPEALRARLEHRLDLLAAGLQDQPERHRTVRAAIGWSYALLSDTQRTMFRCLGVFVGGVSLDAARLVARPASEESEVLADLGGLVDQSLVRQEVLPNGEPYFRTLETIREYAREQLAASGELDEIQRRHAAYYCALAETAEVELQGAAQVAWLDRLERELPDIHAVLAWSERTGRVDLGVRLAAALGWFWFLHDERRDGRGWLERLADLAQSNPSAAPARARALSAAGFLAQYQGDYSAARTFQEASLALGRDLDGPGIVATALGRLASLALASGEFALSVELAAASYERCRQLGDRWGTAFALDVLGRTARTEGRIEDGTRFLGEALGLFRAQGDRWGVAQVLVGLGQLALHQGDFRQAKEYWEERLRLSRELGNQLSVAHTLDLLGTVARLQGDYARAASLYDEALVIRRKTADRPGIAWVLHGMAELALAQGNRASAYAQLRESMLLRRERADRAGLAASFEVFARLAALQRRPRRALRLAGAAAALHRALGPTLAARPYSQGVLPTEPAPIDPQVDRVRRMLSPAQQQAAWAEGETLSPEEAVAEALALETDLAAPSQQSPTAVGGSPLVAADLTRREREVAALIARGNSNRQIAEALVITEGTAHLHVVRLLSKLGFHTRAQVAAWAVTHGLK